MQVGAIGEAHQQAEVKGRGEWEASAQFMRSYATWCIAGPKTIVDTQLIKIRA